MPAECVGGLAVPSREGRDLLRRTQIVLGVYGRG
jgi:hypothetical protein